MRIKYLIIILCPFIGLLLNPVLNAQIYEKLNGPYGGGAKVYEAKNGVLFQFLYEDADKLELYRSINGGAYWNKMPTPPAKFQYDPIEVGYNGNLYCAKNEKLFTSLNDGQSWQSINEPSTETVSCFTALPNGTLLVSNSIEVYQSTNNGQNWNPFPLQNIKGFYFNEFTNQAYAMNATQLYVSNDFGLSWQLLFTDQLGEFKKSLVVTANGFVVIGGEGAIWKLDTTGSLVKKTIISINFIQKVYVAASKSGRMFANADFSSYYSDDFGENWIALKVISPSLNQFASFSGTSDGNIFAKYISGSLYRSMDNGKTWVFSASGINYASISEVEFLLENHLLALTGDGLFYSEDAGLKWSLIFVSQGPQTLFSKTDRLLHFGEEFILSDKSGLYFFNNWMSSAVKIRTNGNNLALPRIFINNKTNTIFSLENYQLFRSIDKGKTWVLNSLKGANDLYAFLDGTLIAIADTGLYKSIDNGENWSLVYSIGFQGDNRILSNGYSNIYIFEYNTARKLLKSIDQGLSWQVIPVLDPNARVIEPELGQICNNLDHLFSASLTNEIYRSVDGGSTFNPYLDGISNIIGLELSPQQKLYILTLNRGLYRTKISTSSTKILSGNVFADDNKNCTKESGESGLKNRLVTLTQGNQTYYAYSNGAGDFRLPVEQGDYTLQVHTNNNTWNSCSKSINAGTYNVLDTLFLGLQINKLCPFMSVDIQAPVLRRCFESEIHVFYSNSGTQLAKDAFIDITLDPFFEFVSSTKPFASKMGDIYRFVLGDVDEGVSGFFSIRIKVSCSASLGQEHCAEAHIYPDTSCNQTVSAHIQTAASCLGDSIELIIRNIGNGDMLSSKKWSVIDQSTSSSNIQTIESGMYFLSAGQEFRKIIASRSRVLFIAEQDNSYPYNKLSTTEIISCTQHPIPGAAVFRITNLDEEEAYISKFCQRNRGSFDPNEIIGYPIGITDKKFISNSQELEYIIRFQNTGTDTAFNIRITNDLPLSNLDLSTFVLGASSHPYSFTLDPKGKLIFTFSNIMLPDSNINSVASNGFIQYRIKPKDKLINGSKILNNANIFFDFNAAVKTNTELHTIGIPIPVKLIHPATSDQIKFEMHPNPMNYTTQIKLNVPNSKDLFYLNCTDLNRKVVWTKSFTGNHITIDKAELKPGIYFISLININKQTIAVEKLVVE